MYLLILTSGNTYHFIFLCFFFCIFIYFSYFLKILKITILRRTDDITFGTNLQILVNKLFNGIIAFYSYFLHPNIQILPHELWASWRRRGGVLRVFGGLLQGSWRCLAGSWRALGGLLGASGGLRGPPRTSRSPRDLPKTTENRRKKQLFCFVRSPPGSFST